MPGSILVEWLAKGPSGFLDIDWREVDVDEWNPMATNVSAQDGEYTWVPPDTVYTMSSLWIRVFDTTTLISDSMLVQLLQRPSVEILSPDTLCVGQFVTAFTNEALPVSWNWNSGDSTDQSTLYAGWYTYEVTIVGENGCSSSATATIFGVSCVGIDEQTAQDELLLGPVPAMDELFASCGEIMSTIEIFDMMGGLRHVRLLDDHKTVLRISDLAAGTYILQIRTARGSIMRKAFIKL